ncbi:Transmembrane protease serine 5, partial [Armadillidium nasatum]
MKAKYLTLTLKNFFILTIIFVLVITILVFLNWNVQLHFGDFISPVCLSPRFETFENRLGIVIGWGTQQYGGTYSNILREVMIKILKRSECEAAFPGFNPITPNMFCAGLGGGDSCQGDSGGPFLIQEPDSRWYVVGIVSRGIGCGELNHPGVYTKINNYLDWIENRIQF